MVAINDPDREMVYRKFSEVGKQLYNRDVREDDDKKLQTAINGMIFIFSGCPVSSAIIGSAVGAHTPEQRQSIDYSIRALFDGMQGAAAEAGHARNAEYISKAIKERFGE